VNNFKPVMDSPETVPVRRTTAVVSGLCSNCGLLLETASVKMLQMLCHSSMTASGEYETIPPPAAS
jgi:hypothetical protein